MSFNSNFEREFIQRSLELVRQYEGPFDATLLLNCLLGLLVVPKESCLQAIPRDLIDDLNNWGISPGRILELGGGSGDNRPDTLRGLVWRLRNAVAHFRFKPYPERGEVRGFCFDDQSGFRAKIPLAELRVFVERLAEHLKDL